MDNICSEYTLGDLALKIQKDEDDNYSVSVNDAIVLKTPEFNRAIGKFYRLVSNIIEDQTEDKDVGLDLLSTKIVQVNRNALRRLATLGKDEEVKMLKGLNINSLKFPYSDDFIEKCPPQAGIIHGLPVPNERNEGDAEAGRTLTRGDLARRGKTELGTPVLVQKLQPKIEDSKDTIPIENPNIADKTEQTENHPKEQEVIENSFDSIRKQLYTLIKKDFPKQYEGEQAHEKVPEDTEQLGESTKPICHTKSLILEKVDALEKGEKRYYLKPGEEAPEGKQVLRGKRGGMYYVLGGPSLSTPEETPSGKENLLETLEPEKEVEKPFVESDESVNPRDGVPYNASRTEFYDLKIKKFDSKYHAKRHKCKVCGKSYEEHYANLGCPSEEDTHVDYNDIEYSDDDSRIKKYVSESLNKPKIDYSESKSLEFSEAIKSIQSKRDKVHLLVSQIDIFEISDKRARILKEWGISSDIPEEDYSKILEDKGEELYDTREELHNEEKQFYKENQIDEYKKTYSDIISDTDRDDLEFANSNVIEYRRESRGSNDKIVVKLKNGSEGLFKFKDGDSGLLASSYGVKKGTFWLREIATYKMSKILNIDNVPVTTSFIYKGDIGSNQKWENGELGCDVNLFELMEEPKYETQVRNIAMLDYLIGNMDRNNGNYLVDQHNKKIWAIDNSLSFPHTKKFGVNQQNFISAIKNKQLESSELSKLKAFRENKEDITKMFSKYLNQKEINGVFSRVDKLLESQKYKLLEG
jgi:hypothetical protein